MMNRFYLLLIASFSMVFISSQTARQFCLKPANLAGGFGTPRGITTGDFDGDGNIDLAAANQNADNISVLLGTGSGNFGAALNYGAGNSPWGITSADFN